MLGVGTFLSMEGPAEMKRSNNIYGNDLELQSANRVSTPLIFCHIMWTSSPPLKRSSNTYGSVVGIAFSQIGFQHHPFPAKGCVLWHFLLGWIYTSLGLWHRGQTLFFEGILMEIIIKYRAIGAN